MANFWTYFDKFYMTFGNFSIMYLHGQILKNNLPKWSHWLCPSADHFPFHSWSLTHTSYFVSDYVYLSHTDIETEWTERRYCRVQSCSKEWLANIKVMFFYTRKTLSLSWIEKKLIFYEKTPFVVFKNRRRLPIGVLSL